MENLCQTFIIYFRTLKCMVLCWQMSRFNYWGNTKWMGKSPLGGLKICWEKNYLLLWLKYIFDFCFVLWTKQVCQVFILQGFLFIWFSSVGICIILVDILLANGNNSFYGAYQLSGLRVWPYFFFFPHVTTFELGPEADAKSTTS